MLSGGQTNGIIARGIVAAGLAFMAALAMASAGCATDQGIGDPAKLKWTVIERFTICHGPEAAVRQAMPAQAIQAGGHTVGYWDPLLRIAYVPDTHWGLDGRPLPSCEILGHEMEHDDALGGDWHR